MGMSYFSFQVSEKDRHLLEITPTLLLGHNLRNYFLNILMMFCRSKNLSISPTQNISPWEFLKKKKVWDSLLISNLEFSKYLLNIMTFSM